MPFGYTACDNNQTPTSNQNFSQSSDNCTTVWQCKYKPSPVNGSCGANPGQCDAGIVVNDNGVNSCNNNRIWTCQWSNWWSSPTCTKYNGDCATYSRSVWVRSSCSNTCGNGNQNRSVVCKDNNWNIVADTNCVNTKPVITQSCNDTSTCSCILPNNCGTYPNCSAPSGCDNVCGSSKSNDSCGVCGWPWPQYTACDGIKKCTQSDANAVVCTYSCQWSVPFGYTACDNNQTPTSNQNFTQSSDNCATPWQCKYRNLVCADNWSQTCWVGSTCTNKTCICNNWWANYPTCTLPKYSCQWSQPTNTISCNNTAPSNSSTSWSLSSTCGTSACTYRNSTCADNGSPTCWLGSTCTNKICCSDPDNNGQCWDQTPIKVNGSCGVNPGQCNAGTTVNDNNINSCNTTRTWTCQWSNGWSNSTCTKYNGDCQPNPINCVWDFGACNKSCGWGSKIYTIAVPAANWWSACSNSNWDAQSCNIQACPPTPTDAVCDNTIRGGCTIGSQSNLTNNWCSKTDTWTCNGINNWANSSCSKANDVCIVAKYSCSGNSCITDPNGTYTSSSCDNACFVPRFSCSSFACIADNNWQYTSSSCNGMCVQVNNSTISGLVYISGTNIYISWVNVVLYKSMNSLTNANTTNSWYLFNNLSMWNYTVGISLPNGYNGNTNSTTINLATNENIRYDFPLTHCGSLWEPYCINNNCSNPICTNWCDINLVNINGICKVPDWNVVVIKSHTWNYKPWDNIVYKIDASNYFATQVDNIELYDYLPDQLSYISSSPTANITNNIIYRTGISLAANETKSFYLTAKISNFATGRISNLWYIKYNNLTWQSVDPVCVCGYDWGPICSDLQCNTCQWNLINVNWMCSSLSWDIKVIKTHTGKNFKPWDIVPYQFAVTNYFNVPISDIEVLDIMPQALSYISSNPSASVNWNVATWNNVTLWVWQTKYFYLTAKVGNNITGKVANLWLVKYPQKPITTWDNPIVDIICLLWNDWDPVRNIDGCTPCEVGNANIWWICKSILWLVKVDKTHTGKNFKIWDIIPYKLSVTNSYSDIISGLILYDYLPSQLTYISSSPIITNITGTLYWDNITLLPWETKNFYLIAKINSGGRIVNLWTVRSILPIVSSWLCDTSIYSWWSNSDVVCIGWNEWDPIRTDSCCSQCQDGLVNIWWICRPQNNPPSGGWGGSVYKTIFCRNNQEIYLFSMQVLSWDIAWTCALSIIPSLEYISVCRDSKTIKVLKDYNFLKWFVVAWDKLWECSTIKWLTLPNYINNLPYENIPVIPKTILPPTGVNILSIKESIRK